MNIKKEVVKIWKKFWWILWKDNSWKGWIFSVLFLLIFIKFIFFPVLSLITGTTLPLAIVESCSMHHKGNFDQWWENSKEWYENKEISKQDFENFPLKKGFNKGDIFFILGIKKEKIKIGDVIIFEAGKSYPIIHRVVNLNPLQTKGDNWLTNPDQLDEEKNIRKNQLIGKTTIIRIPFIGWVKLIAVDIFNKILGRGDFYYIKEGLC